MDNPTKWNNIVHKYRIKGHDLDSLTDIAVFVEVVDAGSFTAAAGRLSLSKAVVSKYVTRLENRLGARLLNRTTRRLSLTEAGRLLYERSRGALEEIDDASAAVSRLNQAPRGTLRINAPMSFGVLHVAPAMPAFLERYPELALDVEFDDRKVDVVAGGFDVSVRIAQLPDASLIARRLGPCRHAVVASPAYLDRRGRPRTPAELAVHDVLTYRYQHSAREWHFTAADGRATSVVVDGRVRMNNSLALREALLAGAGIARMPTFAVGEDIRAGRLVRLLAGYDAVEVSIYAVYAERRHLAPKVRAFIDFMAGRIGERPAWDA